MRAANDTTIMEYTAEDLIAHKLLRSGVLVAKPKFDQEGTDLLAFVGVSDGAKFCRIQCKGRSLINSKNSQVLVPLGYVTDAFILFLFVETGDTDKTYLFCFLGKDIRQWPRSADGKDYVLSISENKLENEFGAFIFNERKIHEIKKAIINVDNIKGEFKKVIYGYGDITLGELVLESHGVVGSPKEKE